MREMLGQHRAPGGWQIAQAAAVTAVRRLPDDVKGIELVILVALGALPVHGHRPAQTLAKLGRTVLKHRPGQKRMGCECLAGQIADHENSSCWIQEDRPAQRYRRRSRARSPLTFP